MTAMEAGGSSSKCAAAARRRGTTSSNSTPNSGGMFPKSILKSGGVASSNEGGGNARGRSAMDRSLSHGDRCRQQSIVTTTIVGGSVAGNNSSGTSLHAIEASCCGWRNGGGQNLRSQMQLFPLTFRDPATERAYVRHVRPSFVVRCNAFAALVVGALFAFNVGSVVFFLLPVAKDKATYCLPVMLPLQVLLFGLVYALTGVPRWNWMKFNPELWTLGIVAALCGGSGLVLTRFAFAMFHNIETMATSVAFKAWTDLWCLGAYMISGLGLLSVFRIRLKNSAPFLLVCTTCAAAPLVVQLCLEITPQHTLLNQQPLVFVPPGVTPGSLNAVTVIQICGMYVLLAFALSAKFYKEVQERIDFVRRHTRLRQVLQLLHERKRRKRGSTLVENLLELMSKASNILTYIQLKNNQESNVLSDAVAVLEECLDTLRNTDELYTIQAGNGDSTSAEYIRMYARYQVRHASVNNSASPDTTGDPPRRAVRENLLSPTSAVLSERAVKMFIDCPLNCSQVQQADSEVVRRLQAEGRAIGRVISGLDFLHLKRELGGGLFVNCGTALLQPYLGELQCEPAVLEQFLSLVGSRYADNPYHNDVHGVLVAHVVHALSFHLKLFDAHGETSSWALPVVAVAGLCHDVGHPGCNNALTVEADWRLAQLYNDSAVLERFHAATTFFCLYHPNTNLFGGLLEPQAREIRQRIIELILATDMSQHFETLSRFRMRRKAADFGVAIHLEDAWATARICMKAADLGHACVNWNSHVEWSLRVTEEFYKQGDAEARLQLPISPLCDRGNHKDFAKSQRGFADFVVMPLLQELEEVDESGTVTTEMIKNLVYNKFKWEELAAKGGAADDDTEKSFMPQIPPEVQAQKVHYDLPARILRSDFRRFLLHRKELLKLHEQQHLREKQRQQEQHEKQPQKLQEQVSAEE